MALIASVAILGACGGGGSNTANTTSGTDTSKTAASTPAAAPAAGGAAATGAASTASPSPITGKTVEIKMIGDAKGYRFEPAAVTIKVGDGIKFVNVTGGPHNVAFNTVPDASKAQLDANMPAQTSSGPGTKLGELSGPLLTQPNDSYTVSFAGVQPGTYDVNCTPHLALGMKGTVTVQ
jgi:plastocyanin